MFATDTEEDLAVRLDIAVGMELRISVLFSTKFAFPSLGELTEIIGKDGRREEEIGYQWRIRLTRLEIRII